MWSLLTPLDSLEDFNEKNCVNACVRIHTEWKLAPPPEGFESAYSFDAWKADNRIHFKAVEKNAHGANGEVTFNFITRRRKLDTGIIGARFDEAYIFEGTGRAASATHIP